jgi:hypothetical protein
MLRIVIPPMELYNEVTNEFETSKEYTLQLEHSLVSLSKWESIWHKPLLSKDKRTREEDISYIKCMTITQNVEPKVYSLITNDIIKKVSDYIQEPMTATIINRRQDVVRREIITSEIIYWWMVALNIPFECQKWHLNRLLTLINVINIKNQPKKKSNSRESLSIRAARNAARRKQQNSKG